MTFASCPSLASGSCDDPAGNLAVALVLLPAVAILALALIVFIVWWRTPSRALARQQRAATERDADRSRTP